MKPDQQASAMNEGNHCHTAELERQQLVKQSHCLVAAMPAQSDWQSVAYGADIASRPGAIKLLRGVIPMLEIYAGYKANCVWRRQRAVDEGAITRRLLTKVALRRHHA